MGPTPDRRIRSLTAILVQRALFLVETVHIFMVASNKLKSIQLPVGAQNPSQEIYPNHMLIC